MGFSVSWLAVRGKDANAVLNELGLRGTGEFEELAESPVCGADVQNGWYVVFVNSRSSRWTLDGRAARLSMNCEVIACSVEETSMYSTADCHSAGKCVWSVAHDSNYGIEHLETDGELPLMFSAIRERLFGKQATADRNADYSVDHIFDIPVELANAITGFRHDEDIPGAGDKPFERLERIIPDSRWWQFWK